MGIFGHLSRNQKEAIGLLQIGSFLEYFDLMLYVHMAVLLNELFFPKSDPHTETLMAAFAFCSSYLLRPFGALLFGYVGDHLGRKTTVVITTMMMAVSCIIMASLPTYAQIGITAAWLVTACRVVQGLSSMGEVIGAEIYVTELVNPPSQYPAVASIAVASVSGTVFALAVASLVTHFGFNWRIAFWIGAGIAVVGSIARSRLRETPEFLEKIYHIREKIKADKVQLGTISNLIKTQKLINKEKMDRRTFWAYLATTPGMPLSFYITYIYFNTTLKVDYHCSASEIIFHNFILSIFALGIFVFVTILSYSVNPLKIVRCKASLGMLLLIALPFVINNSTSYIGIFLFQSFLALTSLSSVPANSILFKSIPTLRRFTTASFIFAMSRALMFVLTSFGLVFLTEKFGYYGLWAITLPVSIAFLWGVSHFEKLQAISPVDPPAVHKSRETIIS